MMNIKEYFYNLYSKTNSESEWNWVSEYEEATYQMFEEGSEADIDLWAEKCGVDLEATDIVLGEPILIITLWGWDMEGA